MCSHSQAFAYLCWNIAFLSRSSRAKKVERGPLMLLLNVYDSTNRQTLTLQVFCDWQGGVAPAPCFSTEEMNGHSVSSYCSARWLTMLLASLISFFRVSTLIGVKGGFPKNKKQTLCLPSPARVILHTKACLWFDRQSGVLSETFWCHSLHHLMNWKSSWFWIYTTVIKHLSTKIKLSDFNHMFCIILCCWFSFISIFSICRIIIAVIIICLCVSRTTSFTKKEG